MGRNSSLWLAILMIAGASICEGQSAHYRHQKAVVLNDLQVTAEAVRTAQVNEVCNTATGTVRHVTAKMKKHVCAFYGVPAARCTGRNFEIDHLIPLELGASNGLSNFWPQPYRPSPAAREKDLLENYCIGRSAQAKMEIQAAQRAIAQNWFSASVGPRVTELSCTACTIAAPLKAPKVMSFGIALIMLHSPTIPLNGCVRGLSRPSRAKPHQVCVRR